MGPTVGSTIYRALDYWTLEEASPITEVQGVEAKARVLYEQIPTPKPKWEQLGQATQSVWIKRARLKEKPDPQVFECLLSLDRAPTTTLFCFLRYPEDFNNKPRIVKPKLRKEQPTSLKPKPKPKSKPLAFKLRGH